MVITENEACENVQIMKSKVNRVTFERLLSDVCRNVVWTDKNKEKACARIYDYFHVNGAGHLIPDITIVTEMVMREHDGVLLSERTYLKEHGKELSHRQMEDLVFRMPY